MVTAAQFAKLMYELWQTRAEMQVKIDQLQHSQDDATQRVVKKLKVDHNYTFKKHENELQFRFNAELQENLKQVNAESLKIIVGIDKERKALDTMKAELQEGLKSIITHQKLIKVANCSEYGWTSTSMETTSWQVTVRMKNAW